MSMAQRLPHSQTWFEDFDEDDLLRSSAYA